MTKKDFAKLALGDRLIYAADDVVGGTVAGTVLARNGQTLHIKWADLPAPILLDYDRRTFGQISKED